MSCDQRTQRLLTTVQRRTRDPGDGGQSALSLETMRFRNDQRRIPAPRGRQGDGMWLEYSWLCSCYAAARGALFHAHRSYRSR